MRRKRTADSQTKGSRLGIFLLPNLLTSASLFCGFYAIIAAVKGQHERAAIAIIIASVFDGLDGRVARMTKSTSRFGVEYDSLSDLVAFGVAPAILVFMWGLQDYGRIGWLAAFLYVATTALRLARFNTLSPGGSSTKKYFLGLPCPAAAVMAATSVALSQHFLVEGVLRHAGILVMVYGLSFLMVSAVRYPSFKNIEWFQRHPFSGMVGLILAMMVIATEPRVTLFVLTAGYVLSGPIRLSVQALFPSLARKSASHTIQRLRGQGEHEQQ